MITINDPYSDPRFNLGIHPIATLEKSAAGYERKPGVKRLGCAAKVTIECNPRFNQATDKSTGYTTTSILAAAVKDVDGQVLGVLQVPREGRTLLYGLPYNSPYNPPLK